MSFPSHSGLYSTTFTLHISQHLRVSYMSDSDLDRYLCTPLFGASLSEPHMNRLSGAGCYGCMYNGSLHVSFGLQGARDHFLHPSTSCVLCGLGQKWLPLMDILNIPCGALQMIIISNETTAAFQSCPPSNDIPYKIGNTSNYYCCMVYALQFQDTLQRGWLKHSNRVQIALVCRHSRHMVSC